VDQNRNHFRIRIEKESYKFSATHFTVFGPNHAERLHGHNYAVTVECGITELDELGMAFEFNTLKPHIKRVADLWDEFVLIPTLNPYLKFGTELLDDVSHTIVTFGNKSYRFPDSDVVKLALRNITSEELAKEFLELLLKQWFEAMPPASRDFLQSRLEWLEVSVEETSGQRATFRRGFDIKLGPMT
jgi:6-pyruvoyltetrahydropterin/6-carboxytetrahydropterin synthase